MAVEEAQGEECKVARGEQEVQAGSRQSGEAADDLTGDEQAGDVLVQAGGNGGVTSVQGFVGDKEHVRSSRPHRAWKSWAVAVGKTEEGCSTKRAYVPS